MLRVVVFRQWHRSQCSHKIFSEKFVTQKRLKLSLHPLLKGSVGSVVQSVRMPPCHGGGRGFESRPVRKALSNEGLFYFTIGNAPEARSCGAFDALQ